MQVRASDTPITDPLLAAVRRRRPDVDLVELPGDPPGEASTGPGRHRDETAADDAGVAAALAEVRDGALLLGADLTEPPSVVVRLVFGSRESDVRATSRLVTTTDAGEAALDGLAARLEARGWALRRQPGGLARLVGQGEGQRLTASYARSTGVLTLVTESDDLAVGVDRARSLVREQRAS